MSNQAIYEMIEREVISQLENGIIPWRQCYHLLGGDCAISSQTKKPYSFLNQMLLHEPGEYWTFNQAVKQGFHIRKGSKSRKIVFWKVMRRSLLKDDELDEADKRKPLEVAIPILKSYNVFHERDIDGLPAKPANTFDEEKNKESIIEADSIITNYLEANKDIKLHESDRVPCFSPTTNCIYIPKKCQFDSLAEYYSTTFHEMTHSTAPKLGRETAALNESHAMYAREELVAEIGAAYLCGAAGINETDVIKNSASYCRSWLLSLRNNIKDLVWASSRAERASRFILGENVDECTE